MYIITRYWDSGRVDAILQSMPILSDSNNDYDIYVDVIDDLQNWIEDNLTIDTDDIISLILKLDKGLYVDITDFC